LFKKKTSGKKIAEMSFLDHLEELRWCLIKIIISVTILMFAAFPFSGKFIQLLCLPNNSLPNPPKLIFLKPSGMLMVRMNVSIALGLIASLPVIFYQLWKFVSPGLLPKEKKVVLPVILFSTLCFLTGAVFAYLVMIPFILPFMYSMATEDIEATLNISEYIGFVVRIILVSGLVFEMPMIVFFLTKLGILQPKMLRKFRRYAIVINFIIAAILTPPDPISQILLAVPLLILYEVSILVSATVYRKKKKAEELLAN